MYCDSESIAYRYSIVLICRISNYLDSNNIVKCHIVSAWTVVESLNLPLTLLCVHKGVLINNENQIESLLHPYQAMAHLCKFNFTPTGYLDTNKNLEELKLMVENQIISF